MEFTLIRVITTLLVYGTGHLFFWKNHDRSNMPKCFQWIIYSYWLRILTILSQQNRSKCVCISWWKKKTVTRKKVCLHSFIFGYPITPQSEIMETLMLRQNFAIFWMAGWSWSEQILMEKFDLMEILSSKKLYFNEKFHPYSVIFQIIFDMVSL